jgi:hypothetical protein
MSHPALQNVVARAIVQLSKVSGRTLLQIEGLDENTHDLVELLQPFGWVASPVQGSDCLEIGVLASGSHKVAIGGDNTADSVANLQPGECGISRAGQLVLVRLTGTRVVSPLFQWGLSEAALKRMITEQFQALYNAHTHPVEGSVTGAPAVPMPDSCLTGGS